MANKYEYVVNDPNTKEYSAKKGGIAVLSYHGKTEKGTKEIAEKASKASEASLYTLHGARVASTGITHTHSDHLSGIKDYAETAVAIHGQHKKGFYERNGKTIDISKTVYVSGGNSNLSKKIAAELKGKLDGYHIETDSRYIPKHLKGESDYNIINKFDKKGVQIEIPLEARKSKKHRDIITKCIADVVNKESDNYSTKPIDNKEYKPNEYKKAA